MSNENCPTFHLFFDESVVLSNCPLDKAYLCIANGSTLAPSYTILDEDTEWEENITNLDVIVFNKNDIPYGALEEEIEYYLEEFGGNNYNVDEFISRENDWLIDEYGSGLTYVGSLGTNEDLVDTANCPVAETGVTWTIGNKEVKSLTINNKIVKSIERISDGVTIYGKEE